MWYLTKRICGTVLPEWWFRIVRNTHDVGGTEGGIPAVKDFYKQIKLDCPETVFHGIDIGHQWTTTEKRFLEYLEQNKLEDTKQCTLAQEGANQGKHYHETYDKVYGDIIYSEDLSWIAKDAGPFRIDTIEVNGKSYKASYFGQHSLGNRDGCAYREDWRLENAYDDFKDAPKTGELAPYSAYPMAIEKEQVYIIDIIKTNGFVLRMYHRSDGAELDGEPATTGFIVG